MEVIVFNGETEIETIKNVTKIKHCEDGRHLVYHTEVCNCCGQQQAFAAQIPSSHNIVIKIEIGKQISIEDM